MGNFNYKWGLVVINDAQVSFSFVSLDPLTSTITVAPILSFPNQTILCEPIQVSVPPVSVLSFASIRKHETELIQDSIDREFERRQKVPTRIYRK